jgi:hypothetical protein
MVKDGQRARCRIEDNGRAARDNGVVNNANVLRDVDYQNET